MKKVVFALSIVATLVMALAVVAWFKFCPKPGADEALTFPVDAEYVRWVGKPADLDFVSLDGRRVTSAELRGKVVLIDFWATWCGPCMQSLDHLKSTYAKYSEQGLEVVGINFDEDRAALESVVASKELPWPQYFEGRDNSVGRKFGISHYPSAWLVDKAGNVRYISALADTDKKISELLAETDAQAVEAGRNANAGYLGRINTGVATIRRLRTAELVSSVTARARTKADSSNSVAAAASPAPASLKGFGDNLKLRSVIVSSKPSAVIRYGDSSRYMSIGDTLRMQTAQGNVELRCDRIETTGVVLTEVQSGEQVHLKLN